MTPDWLSFSAAIASAFFPTIVVLIAVGAW